MTYLDGVEPKRFQNKGAQCGTNSPAACMCGGSTQNSGRDADLDPRQLGADAAGGQDPRPGQTARP